MIRELEDIAIEAIQNETQKIKAAKKKKPKKQSFSQLWNNFKWNNIHVIEVSKNIDKEWETENNI